MVHLYESLTTSVSAIMEDELEQIWISIPNGKSISILTQVPQTGLTLYETLEDRLPHLTTLDYYVADVQGRVISSDTILDHGVCSTHAESDAHQPSQPRAPSPPRLYNLIYRCRGGKGGFGSQLRAQAGRMASQKSTNFEACRDLSGRRLKTVNDAKKLAEYLAKEPERQREKQERIRKKIEDGLKAADRMSTDNSASKGPALSQEYVEELERVGVDVKNAVAKGWCMVATAMCLGDCIGLTFCSQT